MRYLVTRAAWVIGFWLVGGFSRSVFESGRSSVWRNRTAPVAALASNCVRAKGGRRSGASGLDVRRKPGRRRPGGEGGGAQQGLRQGASARLRKSAQWNAGRSE